MEKASTARAHRNTNPPLLRSPMPFDRGKHKQVHDEEKSDGI